jgi:hypothetical protein
MLEINATTEIEAPAEAVWSVLMDLEHFHTWNPFIREAHGTTEVGGTVHVHVQPKLGVRLAFHATVLAREDNHTLRWRGHVGAPWLACGDHTFTLEPIGDHRVRFVQHETFSGVLPWLARGLLARETQRGFEAMNHALEARVQGREAQR